MLNTASLSATLSSIIYDGYQITLIADNTEHKYKLIAHKGTDTQELEWGGVGITAVTQNEDYSLTLTFNDGSTFITAPVKGEKGDKGDAYIITEADKHQIADEVESKYTTDLGEIKQDLTNEQTYSAQLDIWIKRYEKYTDIVQPYNKVVAFIPVLNPKAKIHLILDDIDLAGDYLLVQTAKERTTDSAKIVTTKYKYNKLKQEYVFDALTNDEKFIVISSGTTGKNVVFQLSHTMRLQRVPKTK